MMMIFVSDGVLINGEEIIKRDSREIVCSRRVTIKIENWVDPEARWKVTSDKSIEHVSPFISYPCFGSNRDIFISLSLSLFERGLIRKCSKLCSKRKKYVIVLYICHRHEFGGFSRLATKVSQSFKYSDSMVGKYLGIFGNWFIWVYIRDIDV